MEVLDDREQAAWGGLLVTHSEIWRRLDAELRERHDMTFSTYDVLVKLEVAGKAGMRMGELSDAAFMTSGGTTRLADRLEREGLIDRQRCSSDGRGQVVALTREGKRRLNRARKTHRAGIRRVFLDRLDDADVDALVCVWGKLLDDAVIERYGLRLPAALPSG